MKLDIIELHCFVFGCPALSLIVSLIIESKLEIRHSRKLTIGIHHSDNL